GTGLEDCLALNKQRAKSCQNRASSPKETLIRIYVDGCCCGENKAPGTNKCPGRPKARTRLSVSTPVSTQTNMPAWGGASGARPICANCSRVLCLSALA